MHGILRGGVGHDITTKADLSVLELGMRDLIIDLLLYSLGSGCIKVSFALTLLRILRHRGHRWIVVGTLVVVVGMTIYYFFFSLFRCRPIHYSWTMIQDPYFIEEFFGNDAAAMGFKPKGHCTPLHVMKASTYAHSAMMVAADVTLGIVVPVLLLKDMHMRRGLKITAGVLLGLGSVASIATVVRLRYIEDLVSVHGISVANALFVWSDIEFALCLIATSCATYKPLAVKFAALRDVDDSDRTPPLRRPAPHVRHGRDRSYSYTVDTADELTTQGSDGPKSLGRLRSWFNDKSVAAPLSSMDADVEKADHGVWDGSSRSGTMIDLAQTPEMSVAVGDAAGIGKTVEVRRTVESGEPR